MTKADKIMEAVEGAVIVCGRVDDGLDDAAGGVACAASGDGARRRMEHEICAQ